MNLPNKITLTRIFMIPVFVVVFYCGYLSEWCYLAAAIVFVLAAATDALDGHIARSRNLVTDFGKFLDPIADKVLVSTALIVILTDFRLFYNIGMLSEPPVFLVFSITMGVCVALILARELIVSGFRIIAAGKHLVPAAEKLGKIKTTMQDVAIVVILVAMSILETSAGIWFAFVGLAFLVISTILTVISGVNYIVKNKQVLADSNEKMEETHPEEESK